MTRTHRLISTLLLALAGVLTASCAADKAAGPSSSPEFQGGKGPGGRVAQCALAVPAHTSRIIGPGGGTIGIGKNRLEIPRGALSGSVTISMRIIGDSSSSVQFEPEGLQFAQPAELTLDYEHCVMPSTTARVAYTTNQLEIIEILPSRNDPKDHEVTGLLRHFSKYAVAW